MPHSQITNGITAQTDTVAGPNLGGVVANAPLLRGARPDCVPGTACRPATAAGLPTRDGFETRPARSDIVRGLYGTTFVKVRRRKAKTEIRGTLPEKRAALPKVGSGRLSRERMPRRGCCELGVRILARVRGDDVLRADKNSLQKGGETESGSR